MPNSNPYEAWIPKKAKCLEGKMMAIPHMAMKALVPFPLNNSKGYDVGSFGIHQSIVDDDRALNQ